MLIRCPYCGERGHDEFTYLGDAVLRDRPPADADPEQHFAYVYLRDNPRGVHRELWHHSAGCRCWLIVTRDTATHEIIDVALADRHRGGTA